MQTDVVNKADNRYLAMSIIGGLFFLFGFVTWLNGSLMPFLQIACELNNQQAYLVTMAFYIAYTLAALPASWILSRVGFKNGMVIGLLVMACGALLFVPAASTREYGLFLTALFVLGAGLTLLQTASNPFVVMTGPTASAAVRISVLGILNKSAGVVAPIVFTSLVLSDMSQFSEASLSLLTGGERTATLTELSSRLVKPYLAMAVVLIILGMLLKLSPLMEPQSENNVTDEGESIFAVTRHPKVVLGAITLFFYVGAEVIAADSIGLFGRSQGVENFAQLTSYTMVFMVVGYCFGILAIPRWVSQSKALALSAFAGILITSLLLIANPESHVIWNTVMGWSRLPAIPNTVLFVALFGFSNALVWPAVWPLAVSGLSQKEASTASALLIMGISGGALLPMAYGVLADSTAGEQAAYWIMIPCYLIIAFYAIKGHRLRSWSNAH